MTAPICRHCNLNPVTIPAYACCDDCYRKHHWTDWTRDACRDSYKRQQGKAKNAKAGR